MEEWLTYLFSEFAGSVGGIRDLVIEHGKVERKTEPDWMRRGQIFLCHREGFFICFFWVVDDLWKNKILQLIQQKGNDMLG